MRRNPTKPLTVKMLALATVMTVLIPGTSSALITDLDPHFSTKESTLHFEISRNFPRWQKFPYWLRVGSVAGGSGIYLGQGKVLTAAHVGAGTFITPDGKAHPAKPDSVRVYTNRDGSPCDMCVFEITVPKNSPLSRMKMIPIRTNKMPKNSLVLMIGAGTARHHKSLHWVDDKKMRWGLNQISEVCETPYEGPHGKTSGYYTDFDEGHLDCQGAPGDSGGAAFSYDLASGQWVLVGLMVAASNPQGEQKTRLGDRTFIASLAPMTVSPPVPPQQLTHFFSRDRNPNGMIHVNGKEKTRTVFFRRGDRK